MMFKFLLRISRFFRTVSPALALLVLAPSCRRIPLHDALSGVYLKLDIRLQAITPEDFDPEQYPLFREKLAGKMPRQVRACFYDFLTHELVAEDYLPAGGGFVDVPAGTYDLLVYSLGTETTRVTDAGSRAGAYAFSGGSGSQIKTRAGEGTGAEYPVIFEPDHLFAGRIPDAVIPVRSGTESPVVLETEMTTLLETYTFEIRQVEGVDRIRQADVYITGQAAGKYLWDRRFPGKACAIGFSCGTDAENGRLFSVFNTFGKLPGTRNDVFLHVLASTHDGLRFQWTFNVTDQFDNLDNTRHEIIIEEPLRVPEQDAGGIVPTVGDWNAEIVEIPL